MLSDTTTHEDSVLETETDVEEFPEGQDSEDADQREDEDDVEVKGFTKHALKTNQSLNVHDELLGYLFKSSSPKEAINKIKEENPNLAQRLAKHKKYAGLFAESQPPAAQAQPQENERAVKEAIADIVVDGKRLGFSDRELLRKNDTFLRTLKGFMSAGYSPEVSAHKAFREAYPSKASMVETSFLSAPSEVATEKKQTPEEKSAQKYKNPESYPNFLKKRMKK